MSSFKNSWKNYILSNPELDISNKHLAKIKELSDPATPFGISFEEISKNQGISFICLDPTETFIQLIHHCHVLGGSWSNPNKILLGILGSDKSAKPIQLILKSIKVVKSKTFSIADLIGDEEMVKFSDLKQAKNDFQFRNIIPIPHVLTKAFLALKDVDPHSVAQAFFEAMLEFDKQVLTEESTDTVEIPDLQDEKETDIENSKQVDDTDEKSVKSSSFSAGNEKSGKMFVEFGHVLQFCYLCHKKKVTPVLYSADTTPTIDQWFNSISFACLRPATTSREKRQAQRNETDLESDEDVSSPEQKLSKKDHYFLSTMLKINEAMDKTYKDRSDKEPGFNRLEEHRKNLILNASAIPPFDETAPHPTEFFTTFLSKKSQFKAKDMLVHRLQSEKICFNPGSSFVNNLWNCDLFWLLPDSPSGVSIFFCPETKSANASEIEKDHLLALADKVHLSDIEKLSKQKLYIPNSLMDMVWMTQNFYTVSKLCFGPKAHCSTFLKDWADHMYENRTMYTTQHSADPFFFAKVLYAIDSALQTHWKSCASAEDRLSVNDRVLRMQDVQDSILHLSFSRQIPKAITDKISSHLEKISDKDDKNNGKNGKLNGGRNGNGGNHNKNKDQEVIYNQDKANPHWRLQEGENFSKIFYHKQKECPKTSEGKLICMKFFLRGLCDKSCNRAHNLSKDDTKKFEKFVADCREEAAKKDF